MSNASNIKQVQRFLSRGKRQECNVTFRGFDLMPNSNNKVIVIVTDYRGLAYNVNINWEDDPFSLTNFHDFELRGYYSTKFCNMNYDENTNSLTIVDSNNGGIIILDY